MKRKQTTFSHYTVFKRRERPKGLSKHIGAHWILGTLISDGDTFGSGEVGKLPPVSERRGRKFRPHFTRNGAQRESLLEHGDSSGSLQRRGVEVMVIGTVRPEESRMYDSHEGFHRFHAETTQEEYGSFEIFWDDADESYGHARNFDSDGNKVNLGWYWWPCSPGCTPDGEATGPFAYSQQAHEDADEWSPEYDE